MGHSIATLPLFTAIYLGDFPAPSTTVKNGLTFAFETLMWLTKILSTAMVALLGLLPSSCTKAKNPSAQSASGPETVSVSATNKNLGELSLTNHYETCVDLGAGKSCTIKPNLMNKDNLQLTMAVESKNAIGKTKNLSVVQVVTKMGKSFEVAVGDMNLTLTPRLSE